MKILLSNDDGATADGLKGLHQILSVQFDDITVVAPDRNCSGVSHALTLSQPLRVNHLDNGFYAVNGTPADCVNVAVDNLCQDKPDVLVSGINHGSNLGQDVIYSGTVAAAVEGFQLGVPSIAVSLTGKEHRHYDTAAKVICQLLALIDSGDKVPWDILNVNIPDLPYDQLNGIKVTHLGQRKRSESMTAQQDPWERTIYWYGQLGKPDENGPQADFTAIAQGFASVTPIQVDMTCHKVIAPLTNWINKVKLS